MYLTAKQRAAYDKVEAAFTARRGECRADQWSVSGSRTLHRNYCCPLPPMSDGDEQAKTVARILFSAKPDERNRTTGI
jgi:hypothetical protein